VQVSFLFLVQFSPLEYFSHAANTRATSMFFCPHTWQIPFSQKVFKSWNLPKLKFFKSHIIQLFSRHFEICTSTNCKILSYVCGNLLLITAIWENNGDSDVATSLGCVQPIIYIYTACLQAFVSNLLPNYLWPNHVMLIIQLISWNCD
jgi:hypothetical protein